MDPNERIKERMKQALLEQGMTKAALARKLGVKPQSVDVLFKPDKAKVPESLLHALEALNLELTVQPSSRTKDVTP